MVLLATVQSSAALGRCPALLALNPPNLSDPMGACRRKFDWTVVGPTAPLDLYNATVTPAAMFGYSCVRVRVRVRVRVGVMVSVRVRVRVRVRDLYDASVSPAAVLVCSCAAPPNPS